MKINEYPDEVVEYVRKYCKEYTKPELVEMLKRDLNFDTDRQYLKNLMRKFDLRSGIDTRFQKGLISPRKGEKMSKEMYEKARPTMFKKGNIPPQHRPVGTITKSKDGYWIKKIAEGTPGHNRQCDLWKPLHRLKWEEYHNQKVPEGYVVLFADGNKDNFSEDNLFLVSRREMATMNKKKLISEDKDITKANVLVTRIDNKIRDLKERKE